MDAGGQELNIREVEVSRWFVPLGLPEVYEPGIQELVGRALVGVVRPIAERAIIVTEVLPRRIPAGTMALQVRRTNIYIHVKGISRMRIAVLAGLVAGGLSQSVPVAAVTAMAATLWEQVKILGDDQVEMIDRFRYLNGCASPYKEWVRQERILSSYPPNERESARKLLASMKSSGYLEEGGGLWRVVL